MVNNVSCDSRSWLLLLMFASVCEELKAAVVVGFPIVVFVWWVF